MKGRKYMEAIYYNGRILTMEGCENERYPQGLLVRNGKIAALGEMQALQAQAPLARLVDLEGHALLPAFIDSHSHITGYASTMGLVQLEGLNSFAALQQAIKAFLHANGVAPGKWVTGFGYDHNDFAQRCHPDRKVLDAVAPDIPVLITHKSGHMGVANTRALELMGITAATPDPEGGKIGREADGKTPNGYLEETAFTTGTTAMPKPTLEDMLQALDAAQEKYLSYGVTTMQDGLTRKGDWTLLQAAAEQGRLKADVVSYIDENLEQALLERETAYLGKYAGRLKIGGYKIFLDGSPQGRTAWMTQPYLGGEPGYQGYPVHSDDKVLAFVGAARERGIQLLTHCNGDAAAEQLLQAFEKTGGPTNTRPVMIHAQLLRPDQLPRLAKLGMIASFFVAHTYHWGDVHVQNFSMERAGCISPAHSALKTGVRFTFHQDTPVLPPNMLETVWCAAKRITKKGTVLGEQERITPYEALQAVTIQGAYQYFEENQKGTLTPGKLADMVILSKDPTACPLDEIPEIQVLETIKEAKTVYRAQG